MSHHDLQNYDRDFSAVGCDGCVGVAQLVGGEAFMKAMPDKLVLKCVQQNRILAFGDGFAVAMKNKIVFFGNLVFLIDRKAVGWVCFMYAAAVLRVPS